MSNIQGASAPAKSTVENKLTVDSSGERDLMLSALRAASARIRLAGIEIDHIGIALRQKAITCEAALNWVRDEGLLDWVQIGRGLEGGK